MTGVPLLGDFVIRLALGLSAAAILIPWRAVPLAFFRTQSLVILGIAVLGALVQSRSGQRPVFLWLAVAASILGYLSAVCWGMGLPRLAIGSLSAVAIAATAWLAVASWAADPRIWALNGFARVMSGLLLGATLTAMLLGHHYLTAPSMSIEPLRRAVLWIAAVLVARFALALACVMAARAGLPGAVHLPASFDSELVLSARWGLGFLGTGIAIFLTWKTVELRSTQSATGILYIAMIFVLFGELTSLILAGNGGLVS